MPGHDHGCPGDSTFHCWHFTGVMLMTIPPYLKRRCCWCAGEYDDPVQYDSFIRPHGPHVPEGQPCA